MAGVAQLVRAPGCGSGCRRFDPGHSPHLFLFLVLDFCLNFLHAETQRAMDAQHAIVSSVIPHQTTFNILHKKPAVTIILDQFCMRDDISRKLLEQVSSDIILCVPAHCIYQENLIAEAKKLHFNLSLSIDYLNEHQWKKVQEIIEKNSWIKGLVVWSVDSHLKLSDFLKEIKDWLNTRHIWLVYANTNNALPNPDVRTDIVMPDGFVRTTDDHYYLSQLSDFVVNQAAFKNNGVLLVELAVHHVDSFVKWLQENRANIQLNSWETNA